ncbi:hypothetical protein M9H77_29811 [Catharanthus roseus]|uniref:Uncharacterized protein n=1 Tax=Catharanthus roseus TaxID=4058 RepID=A0ACB9ZW92_CATRO|nr:hypothetical protein M9H77_29811 [Catharanthus roseus]
MRECPVWGQRKKCKNLKDFSAIMRVSGAKWVGDLWTHDNGYFLASWVRRGSPARVAQGGLFRWRRSSSSRMYSSFMFLAKGRDGDAWIEAERGEEITTEELTADAMDSDTEEIEGEEEIAKDDPIEDKKEDRPIIDGELVKQKKSDDRLSDINRESQETLELMHRPLIRAKAKKIKANDKVNDGILVKGLVAFMEEAIKNKYEGFEDQRDPSKFLTFYTISKDCSSEQVKGGKWLSLNTYIQLSALIFYLLGIVALGLSWLIGLARRFQSVARDVEELKKGKNISTVEQKSWRTPRGFHSPHHQRPYDNVSLYGYHHMLVQKSYPFFEGGYQGRQPIRGGRRGSWKKRIS